MFRKILIAVVVVVALLGIGAWQMMKLPKPQIASAEGKLAPDFELKDQEGNTFRLADQRGRGLVLIFYRGYW